MAALRSHTLTIILAALVFLALPAGCAYLLRAEDKAAEQAARGLKEYCENTDQAFRDRFRAKVDAEAAPHTAVITCN